MDDNEYKIMEIADSFRRKYNFQSGEELEKYRDEFIEKIKENNLIYDRALTLNFPLTLAPFANSNSAKSKSVFSAANWRAVLPF